MIEAVGKHIILKPIYEEKKNNLILTGQEEKPIAWKVVSYGIEVNCLTVGDKVFIAPYGLQEIKYENDKYYICQLESIYAKNVI